MHDNSSEIESLLGRAGAGDASARQRLLERHRGRLRRMVSVRLDPKLAARLDPSDIVQESLADAARKLDGYLARRPLPFYPWLHRLARERLALAHRHHLGCRKRDAGREAYSLMEASTARLADHLSADGSTPSRSLGRAERRLRLFEVLAAMPENDREVLVMRYLEGLPFAEIAETLGITEGAAKVRHFRALERIRLRLGDDPQGWLP